MTSEPGIHLRNFVFLSSNNGLSQLPYLGVTAMF
jgi:hypothetical protein